MPHRLILSLALAAVAVAVAAWGASAEAESEAAAVTPGRLFIEPATTRALGFRWQVHGDRDGDATVRLRYRRAGAADWRPGPALFRVGLESRQPRRRPRPGVVMAGSLVGLEPGSRYEVELSLADPDGGGERRRFLLRTAPEPALPGGLRRRHVVPAGTAGTAGAASPGSGTAEDPYVGLRPAVRAAGPGDLLLLAPGTYLGGALDDLPSGKPGRPLVIQGKAAGAVILDGGGAERLLDLSDRRSLWLRGLVLRNADTLILADRARNIVVQGNRFEVSRAGHVASGAVGDESYGQYILDNRFTGPTEWPRSKGIEHVFGVAVSGSGHVIAHNHMENLGDCIRGAWADGGYGLLSASDIHHNDLLSCTDDGIEVDHADANVRVFANRITNSFAAISLQPIFGGPVYLYRNRIYNSLYAPFKLHNNTAGVMMIHNTSIRAGIPFHIRTATETVRDSLTRNNLFVGTAGPALTSTARMIGNDFDGDGYAWGAGAFALWNGRTYASADAARRSGALYRRHGAVSLDPARLFRDPIAPVADEARRYEAADNRPLLAADSPAVDRGLPLATFNDGFLGAAPDLGCCELGRSLPAVGPRPPYAP